MKEKLELVIFDMDGLMIDTESICIKAWEKTMGNFNIKVEKDFFQDVIGSSANALRIKMDKVLKNKFDFMEVLNYQRRSAAEIVDNEGIKRKKGIIELLDYLEENNIKKAVATSSFREKVEKYLKLTELTGKFDYIICGDEVDEPKPAPDLYTKAHGYFNIDESNLMILEDSLNGLNSARAAGIRKRIYIPDLVVLSENQEKELVYKKFENLLEVRNFLEKYENRI